MQSGLPQAFSVQALLRLGSKFAVSDDVDHACNVFIVHFRRRHRRTPFDGCPGTSIGFWASGFKGLFANNAFERA
jgi:hypothetical protein